MALRSRNFLPFHIKKEGPPPIEIEPRPGLEPEDDIFDQPYRFDQPAKPEPEEIIFVSEYHHGNMNFWWFIMGAILISIFVTIVEHSKDGVGSEWYQSLEFFPGSPDPALIFLGNTFLFLLLAWSAYHMFKHNNTQIVRYGAVFLMVGVYILVLIWSLLLFADNTPRNAMLFLIMAALLVTGWILLSKYNDPDNHEILIALILGLLWIIYLLYFTLGIINENEDTTIQTTDQII